MQSLSQKPKLILMSTTAYTNKSLGETNTFGEGVIFSALHLLLPPHKDNMLAADHLVYKVGEGSGIDWVAVRPDSLFDEEEASEYEVVQSKRQSPIFNPGKTSRLNVSRFMVELLASDELWQRWRHKTPVIYNKA